MTVPLREVRMFLLRTSEYPAARTIPTMEALDAPAGLDHCCSTGELSNRKASKYTATEVGGQSHGSNTGSGVSATNLLPPGTALANDPTLVA